MDIHSPEIDRNGRTGRDPLLMEVERVNFHAADGIALHGHYWPARADPVAGVIVNAATGVLAGYYHRYARHLADCGFDVLTYDYRGIGESRPRDLRRCPYRWRDWGEYDFDAALRFIRQRSAKPICVVGHSIGGILPGLAAGTAGVHRMLTVGAQYAWWRDYAIGHRGRMFRKWHIVMPLLTAILGYFPGKRLGWLEDLPSGVAFEWSFRGPRMERSYPRTRRSSVLRNFEAVRCDILAVTATDDEYATRRAVCRGLSYFANASTSLVELRPADFGMDRIGHFDLFHARHRDGFWKASADWLKSGVNPWPHRVVHTCPAQPGTTPGATHTSLPAAGSQRCASRELARLLELDDRLLSDVGLTRDQLLHHLRHHGVEPGIGHGMTTSGTRRRGDTGIDPLSGSPW